MKKPIAAMLVSAVLCCSLAACGSSSHQPASSGQQGSQAATQQHAAANSAAPAKTTGDDASSAEGAKDSSAFIVSAGDMHLAVTPADTDAARVLAERLQAGPVTVNLHEYGGFEKVGPLPWALPTNDEQIATQPGDVMLYQGSQITIFMGSNSWAYTSLGHIEGATSESLIEALGDGDVEVTLSLR